MAREIAALIKRAISETSSSTTLPPERLTSLLATLAALKVVLPERYKFAASPVIAKLKQLKAESDRRNWEAKHALVRELLDKYPGDFKIDYEDDHLVGLTHKSGFRFHAPKKILPHGWKSRLPAEDFVMPKEDLDLSAQSRPGLVGQNLAKL